jgi:hypothetical protein
MGFPNLPGIPPLAGGLAGAVTLASPLTSNLLELLKPSWGIFDSTGKKQVIKPDAFLSISYHNEYNMPTVPLETGGFDTYNKVATPYDITVRVAKGNQLGFGQDKMIDFLKILESIVRDVLLYNVVTPDATYINANLKGFDYKREMHNGANIIIADLHFMEVMRAPSSTATATSVPPNATKVTSPSAAASITNGFLPSTPVSAGTTNFLSGVH